MTSITTEPMAPVQHVAPRPQKRHLLVPVLLTITLLALAAVSAWTIAQHNTLTDTRADLASMTGQRDGLKTDLGKAKDANAGLRSANQTLTETAKTCSAYVPISNHLLKAVGYELKAVQGGMFGSIIWLPKASDEISQATRLMKNNQTASGGLAALCGPSGAGSNA